MKLNLFVSLAVILMSLESMAGAKGACYSMAKEGIDGGAICIRYGDTAPNSDGKVLVDVVMGNSGEFQCEKQVPSVTYLAEGYGAETQMDLTNYKVSMLGGTFEGNITFKDRKTDKEVASYSYYKIEVEGFYEKTISACDVK